MNDDERQALLTESEEEVFAAADEALQAVAEEFAREVGDADELTAAVFSVQRIRDMWSRHVDPILQRVRRVFTRSFDAVATDEGVTPDGAATAADAYVAATRPLIAGVGDDLAKEVRRVLRKGVAEGDAPDLLKRRVLASMGPGGTQVSEARARMIAVTESTRAYNSGILDIARRYNLDSGVNVTKTWVSRRDAAVRPAHGAADGQEVDVNQPFTVGGYRMSGPGDLSAPADLTIGCRCIMRINVKNRTVTAAADQLDERDERADRAWSTPAPLALAYEDEGTGDERVIAPGALEWDEDDGPWPLMANETFASHNDASLIGSITDLGRDGGRITGAGYLYGNSSIGAEAIELLEKNAPLGVSVDLDDIDIELVSEADPAEPMTEEADPVEYAASLAFATLTVYPNGGAVLRGRTGERFTASGSGAYVFESSDITLYADEHGCVPAEAFDIVAAAGDPADGGTVVDRQESGSMRLRITRARVRGATLVSVPAFAGAAIALAPEGVQVAPPADETADSPPTEEDDDEFLALAASAWAAMVDLPPMPAQWFAEPDLGPDSPGVNYEDGRIYGWVARAGEPHAGFPGRSLTIESLGSIDTSHFLRQRFHLDDGETVAAGALTMNAGHHRDGAECETDACQFDDTRTVAGIVTVGMNEGGMWFSGAAAPWISEWDRAVFAACQPSYHMRQGSDGVWQLRAVLSVPVPGHSTPLSASDVAHRSNLTLAASAREVVKDHELCAGMPCVAVPCPTEQPVKVPAQPTDDDLSRVLASHINYSQLAEAVVDRQEQLKAERAELKALRAEAAKLDSDSNEGSHHGEL